MSRLHVTRMLSILWDHYTVFFFIQALSPDGQWACWLVQMSWLICHQQRQVARVHQIL